MSSHRIYSYTGTVYGLSQEITRFQPLTKPPMSKSNFYLGCALMVAFGSLIAIALS